MTLNNVHEDFSVKNGIYQQKVVSQKPDTNVFFAPFPEKEDNSIPMIAHRGYSSIAPENTLPAYYLAAEKGFTTAECDIEWTKDNVPILLHDSTINRTARTEAGSKFIMPRYCEDYTYEELLQLDFGSWKGEEYKGTKIPSFHELLQCSKETGLNLYVEIKETTKFDKEKAEILVKAVKEAGLEDKITWISFNSDYLKIISELMPESRFGYLVNDKVTPEIIEDMDAIKTDTNEVFLDIKSSKMDSYADYLLDNAGYPFEAWTIDNVSDIDKIYDFECSGITTNCLTQEEVGKYLDTKN